MALILGIDPGSRITGYGLIQTTGRHIQYVASGCIRMTDQSLPLRLKQIFDGVRQLIEQFQPHEFAIEQVFMSKNADSALKLGHARGAALVAATHANLPTAEYAARAIKQSVVGTGAADKKQVQHMVMQILKLAKSPQADAADALAVAICHHHTSMSLIAISKNTNTARHHLL
tara:strand:- start:7727 stop:8245 length:519 start_codon:yes stop_codon:yes gene_type:complete